METRTADGRLAAWIFDLPVVELRAGYRAAVYFDRSRRILAAEGDDTRVTMQVFQRSDAMVACGIDEALAVLALGAGSFRDAEAADRAFAAYLTARDAARRARSVGGEAWIERMRAQVEAEAAFDRHWRRAEPGELEGLALRDGDLVDAWEPVIELTAPYRLVAHLESVYLGVLARRTLVASNVRRVVDAAGGKPVLFFADRFDHWATQGGDGYAAFVGRPGGGHRRPGGLVGRARPRHHPPRPDRHLRRGHRGRGGRLRPPVPRGAADRPGRLPQRLGGDLAGLRPGVRGAALGGAAGHLRDHGRPVAVVGDGGLRPHRGQPAAGREGPPGPRRRGVHPRPGDRLGRLQRRPDRRLRGHRGPGRLLRGRLLAAQGQRRLHRRRGPARGPALRQGGPGPPPLGPPAAGRPERPPGRTGPGIDCPPCHCCPKAPAAGCATRPWPPPGGCPPAPSGSATSATSSPCSPPARAGGRRSPRASTGSTTTAARPAGPGRTPPSWA